MKKRNFFWLLPILVIIFLASACSILTEVENEETDLGNNQDQEIIGQSLDFETLFLTTDARYEEERFYTINDEETFTDLWVNTLEQEVFEVDFDRKMVLAVFTGEKPSGGYQVEIIEIIEKENTIEIMINEIAPGADDMVTMALTYPGHIIMLEKNEKEVVFNTSR